MVTTTDKCPICKRGVKCSDQAAECSICKFKLHQKCLPIYQNEDIRYANQIDSHWTCPNCLKEIFPLYTLEENEEILDFFNDTGYNSIERLNNLLFDPFELSEEGGVFEEIDPDDNHLNVLASQTVHKCKYYFPDALKSEIEKKNSPVNLSILHLNIRSMAKNYRMLLNTLEIIENKFDVIILSETWIKPHNVDTTIKNL